jgi:uncharacterized FlgJ-related protein
MKTPVKSDDRIIELGQIPGQEKITTNSMADPGLLKGTNKLHAVMNPQFGSWKLKYEKGDLPVSLKGNYTTFNLAKEAAQRYFNNKGLEVVKVID